MYFDLIQDYTHNQPLSIALLLLLTALCAWSAYYLSHWVLMSVVRQIVKRTATTWDDDLLNDRVLRAICRLMPPLAISILLPDIEEHAPWIHWLIKTNQVYISITVIAIICAVMRGVAYHMRALPRFSSYPVEGVYQAAKLIVIILGSISCLAIIISKDPFAIIAGLGASAAVLSLVFKDPLMGFVAGIQLSANNMISEGDWIVAPKFNADGNVLSIGLTTIKVQNWDKTVTTIPTYALISESFQNWARMQAFGARRVKRSVYVDVNTVRFLDADELSALAADGFMPDGNAADGTKVVNLRLFRDYLEAYLKTRPDVSAIDGTTTMVRQLQP
ncbi:MAG: mechanosensitive ion channel family protein, partial [Muribaculaceae bacterium]|nr:mechanosensitive ion channel family protein [Muribaculaceae bacterium]